MIFLSCSVFRNDMRGIDNQPRQQIVIIIITEINVLVNSFAPENKKGETLFAGFPVKSVSKVLFYLSSPYSPAKNSAE